MGPLGYPELIVIALIGFAFIATGFWIWMLVDCIINEPAEGNDKVVWVVVIALAGGVGAVVYFFARRPDRIRQFEK